MIKEATAKIIERIDLAQEETEKAFEEIMSGVATASQIAAFITALRMKGETVEEISGAASIMRRHVTKINVDKENILDTCGTGGDSKHTFNISTISAFVACAAGLTLAKHGNRSVSSKCGSADLLKELGVNIEVSPAVVEKCLAEIGIGFLFAPLLHRAMKYATPVRREIGIRTVFNILGPLTNPAGAVNQLLGVYDANLVEPLANVLGKLGSRHCLVVHGLDGMDEVTTTNETLVCELKDGKINSFKIKPEDFAIPRAKAEDLVGGDASFNAQLCQRILEGEKGPPRDIVILNAGCAIYAGEGAKDINQGIKLAGQAIDSGAALKKLELLKEYTNKI